MGRLQDRADRFVRVVFQKPASSTNRPVNIVSLQEKLRKRREQALKTRRGL